MGTTDECADADENKRLKFLSLWLLKWYIFSKRGTVTHYK